MVALCTTLTFDACIFRRSAVDVANSDDDSVELDIANHNTLDVVVYNVRQGQRERIGDVTALSKASFVLHLNHYPAGEIQLFAHGIGSSRGVTSEVLHPFAGQTVEWTLENDMRRAFVMIRD